MKWRALGAAAAVAAALALGVAAVGRPDVATSTVGADGAPTSRPVVLVSGRDDHGLLASTMVPMAGRPDGPTRRRVSDATLVAVLDTRGAWLKVRTITGPAAEGWINDFHLRGTVHLRAADGQCQVGLTTRPGGAAATRVPANTQAEMLAIAHVGERPWVRVRPAGANTGWVDLAAVQELPGDRAITDGHHCRTASTTPPNDHHQGSATEGHHH